jgi:CP family cyanate transporter-like MFS transporter
VLCFAALGALAAPLSRRLGPEPLLVAALTAATVGSVLRSLASSGLAFALLTALTRSGGAMSNVLLPSLVKRYFPDRIGWMTALYTTVLAIGATLGGGLTVPISELGGSWRLGLGSWAVASPPSRCCRGCRACCAAGGSARTSARRAGARHPAASPRSGWPRARQPGH